MRKMQKLLTKKKLLFAIPIIIGVILVLAMIGLHLLGAFDKGEIKIITSSTLIDALEDSHLSSAEFIYNGVAEISKEKEKKHRKCYVRYYSVIKAGVDIKEIDFEIDRANKTVKPILPEIEIRVSEIIDEGTYSYIPHDAVVKTKDVLSACKKDARKEARKSTKLHASAEKNLQNIIEGLLDPIIKAHGYSIIWEEK